MLYLATFVFASLPCLNLALCFRVFGVLLNCGDGWSVGSSLVPACQHALIWMFLFYFVCLFVCVCILCSVVYQDGFYGADIYVSITSWYIILHATPPSPWFLPCCFAHATFPLQPSTLTHDLTLSCVSRGAIQTTEKTRVWKMMRGAPMHFKAVINMCGNTVSKWLNSGDITED